MKTKDSLADVLLFVRQNKRVTEALLKEKFHIYQGNCMRNRDLDFFLRTGLFRQYRVLDDDGVARDFISLGERAKVVLKLLADEPVYTADEKRTAETVAMCGLRQR